MNKIITRICILAFLVLPGRGTALLAAARCYAVADTAFVCDTARVVSTRLSAGTLVVDTTLMVTTTYVVDTATVAVGPAVVPSVSDSLSVRSVAGTGVPDTCIIEWADSFALTLQFPLTTSRREVKKDYCMWFTPSLCGTGDTLALPAVVFQGKRHRKYSAREAWLDSRQEWYPSVPKGVPGDTLWYEMRIARATVDALRQSRPLPYPRERRLLLGRYPCPLVPRAVSLHTAL